MNSQLIELFYKLKKFNTQFKNNKLRFVTNNSVSVGIPTHILQALTSGQSYDLSANVSDQAGNAAQTVTSSTFTVTVTATPYNIVDGSIPDWQQPSYYSSIMGGYEVSFNAWCAPTTAANHLGYLVDNAFTGVTNPTDNNVSPTTIAWDSGVNGWGDYMLDGSGIRGNGSLTDFGWYMNTNDLGQLGAAANSPVGTTIANMYNGLKNFYIAHNGGTTTGLTTGLVYNKITGQIVDASPEYYASSGNADPTDKDNFLLTIQDEIDKNRPVIACYASWNLQPAVGIGPLTFTGEVEEPHPGEFYEFGALSDVNNDTGEEYSHPNPDDLTDETIQNALGHSVLIIGYIKKGTAEDKSVGNNTDWLIVRDNQDTTVRNVIVPFEDVAANDPKGWNNILATIYVRP